MAIKDLVIIVLKVKNFKKFIKNTCKIKKVILQSNKSGAKWNKVVNWWKEVKLIANW